jgi:anthranilate phosphoribosyltransferase
LADGEIHTWTFDPESLCIPYARLSDLQVDSVDQAADAMRRVFAAEKGPLYDIAALNTAAALVVADRAETLEAGMKQAREALDSGAARTTLEKLVACSRQNA